MPVQWDSRHTLQRRLSISQPNRNAVVGSRSNPAPTSSHLTLGRPRTTPPAGRAISVVTAFQSVICIGGHKGRVQREDLNCIRNAWKLLPGENVCQKLM